jgi:hypothetical protein
MKYSQPTANIFFTCNTLLSFLPIEKVCILLHACDTLCAITIVLMRGKDMGDNNKTLCHSENSTRHTNTYVHLYL